MYLILRWGNNSVVDAGRNSNMIDIFFVLISWMAIGLVAMPVSWFVVRSLGWNLDLIALMQSSGQYKSYKDWSEAEERLKQAEEARKSAKRQLRKEEARKRMEERRRADAIKRAQAEEKARAEAARVDAEERARARQIQVELEKRRDPVWQRERDEAHRRHLESVGCIDAGGHVIRDLFCLNTEAPSR